MKHSLITVVNAAGCFVLLGVTTLQWRQNENRRQEFQALQFQQQATAESRDEALKRAASLTSDLADLKASLEATIKAAEQAANAGKDNAERLQAAQSSSELARAENEALRQSIATWEAAVQQRDDNITRQNETINALRKKLDEAIERLKKSGAR